MFGYKIYVKIFSFFDLFKNQTLNKRPLVQLEDTYLTYKILRCCLKALIFQKQTSVICKKHQVRHVYLNFIELIVHTYISALTKNL